MKTDKKHKKRRHEDPEQPEGAEAPAEDRLAELETLLAEAEGRYKRALADYQNFQRRAADNERRSREDGMARVVETIVPVLDHFALALEMDPASTSAEQVIGGVKVIRDELTRALAAYGVAPIEPEKGEPFDPMRHEAMMMADDETVEPGSVVMMLQKGYALGERVIRAAKVSVRPGDDGPATGEPDDDAPEEDA
jgi:molecular chaperone GrpE